jgi:peptidoglycan hydrolase-like protein with peptidoglycan-binding domain
MRGYRWGVAGAWLALVAFGVAASGAWGASADVAALQVALNASGYSAGPVDGVSGPLTQAATVSFQERHGLTGDGIAGPLTREALGDRGGPLLGSRPMSPGASGWDVAALQFLLQERGFGPGAIDGAFGAGTSDAVSRFQGAAGLSVDGVAGSLTLAALQGQQVTTASTGSGVFARPVAGAWTDGFGWVDGRRHTGLDFPEPEGTPVHAAAAGTVSFAGFNDGGYGNLIVVADAGGYETWYAHLSSMSVGAGAVVGAGSVLGAVGATGRATGPHLHFEVRRYGTPVDPAPLLSGTVALRANRARGGQHRSPTTRRRLRCRANADARHTHDTDPPFARMDRCP